jgi:hypothetical protein
MHWHANSTSILIVAFVTIEETLRALTFRWIKSILVAQIVQVFGLLLWLQFEEQLAAGAIDGFRFWTN